MYWKVPTMVPSAVSGWLRVGDSVSSPAAAASPVRARQAEVHELGAALREHDVAGLEVAVDDPRPVRAVQRIGDLDAAAQQLGGGQRPALEALGQGLALEVLHDEIDQVALAPDVVERADVGVVQRGDRAGLALEARAQLGRRGQVRGAGP